MKQTGDRSLTRSSFSVFVLLPLIAAAGCNQKPVATAKTDSGPIGVRVAPVKTRQIQRNVESVGTLFAFDETLISAEVDGRVDKVLVDLGDQVAAGQLLVQISDEEQRYLVMQTEAQLGMALERLGLKNEADRIKDVRDTSEVRRAQADLTEAEQRYKRVRTLVDQGIGAQTELDQAQARLKVAQAGYDQAVNSIRNLIQEVERSKAQLQLQRKKLRDTKVTAPFSARVKERQVTPGAFVRSNTPLITLVKTDPIRLRLEMPERLAPWIRVGQVADISMEAYAERQFRGRIWRISPTVDSTKRTFVVEALIDNPDGSLKPGSYAKARLNTDHVEEIRVVPARAVSYVLGTNKAFVVKVDNTIDAREVKLGDRLNNEVEIIEGLEQGESVALTQLNRLDAGVKVKIAPDEPAASARKAE